MHIATEVVAADNVVDKHLTLLSAIFYKLLFCKPTCDGNNKLNWFVNKP